MIELVDRIGVLIDESVDIVDINKEDEFIMRIDNDMLNEGLEGHYTDIGVIFEAKGGSNPPTQYNINKNTRQETKQQQLTNSNKGYVDGQDSQGSNLDSTTETPPTTVASKSESMNARADKLEYNSAIRDAQQPWDGQKKAWGDEEPGLLSTMANAVKANPIVALGAAVVAAAGAYAIVKYLNSIYRLNKATNYYKQKAASASDPGKKAEFTAKANTYGKRLDEAKAKARENKKDYIVKTKNMQSRLGELKKANGDAKEISKLEKKLASRNKVLSKIGAL